MHPLQPEQLPWVSHSNSVVLLQVTSGGKGKEENLDRIYRMRDNRRGEVEQKVAKVAKLREEERRREMLAEYPFLRRFSKHLSSLILSILSKYSPSFL